MLFSAELDRDSVYVQQQVLLTLRIQQAIALDDRSVTELKLDGAFVKPLGQNSFQRDDGSRARWAAASGGSASVEEIQVHMMPVVRVATAHRLRPTRGWTEAELGGHSGR